MSERDPQARLAYQRAYRARNPEKKRAYENARRRRLKEAGLIGGVDAHARSLSLKRLEGVCLTCCECREPYHPKDWMSVYRARNGANTYCSVQCTSRALHAAPWRYGERNPSFKHGLLSKAAIADRRNIAANRRLIREIEEYIQNGAP